MRTTKQLSKAYIAIQEEAIERIKSFFKDKPYVRIIIEPRQHLNISTGTGLAVVTEIKSDGSVLFTQGKQNCISNPQYCELLPADALLCILDELERMKKANLLKKP